MTLNVTVDSRMAGDCAHRLLGIVPGSSHFLPRPLRPAATGRLVEAYLVAVGICQQTRTLAGRVKGVWYRGSDYLLHRLVDILDADPGEFDPFRLRDLTASHLLAWLSDGGDPATSCCDRVEERVRLVRDLGVRLIEGYDGQAANLLGASKGRLAGRRGLLERLSRFEAYRDPVKKKSFLLIHFLRGLGVFEPVDPDTLGLPADYHILRVFLRTGILRIDGPRAAALLSGGVMTAGEDQVLREAAVRAGRVMATILPLGTLDLLLWMLGRNCCFYDHEPVCRTGPCGLASSCSFRASTDLDCSLKCPFDGVCRGSGDAAAAAFREPSFDTDFY